MSSGAKTVTAFIREVTTGVTPTSGKWDLLTRTSYGVKPTQNTSDNDEIGGSRMAQGKSLTTVDVGGDVGAKFRYGQHDAFLASCFGSEWVNNTLTMGDSRNSDPIVGLYDETLPKSSVKQTMRIAPHREA